MKKTSDIFQVMKDRLHSNEFQSLHRISESDFIRNRILSFTITFAIIFNAIRDSSSAEFDKFCEYFEVPYFTKSAFSQARQKLSPSAFIDLNNVIAKEYYTDNIIKKFHGLTVLAIDGYDLQLPVNDKIIKHFGYSSNQTNRKIPMAQASELYDVDNEITIDAIISPYNSSEREIALEHVKNFMSMKLDKNKYIIIFDRGYPSILLICYLIQHGIPFLIRSSTGFLKEVNEVIRNKKKDEIIEISLKRLRKTERNKLLEWFPNINVNNKIKFRVLIIYLSTGEIEILLTSLLDKKKFPRKIFCEFYFKRWGVETDIGFQKCRIEIENFAGESIVAVQQEFHATILYKNSTKLLTMEANRELDEEKIDISSSCKSQYTDKMSAITDVLDHQPDKTLTKKVLKNKKNTNTILIIV